MSGDERSREEQSGTDERSREEQSGTDERSREEQSGTDERSREEQSDTDEHSREERASAKPLVALVAGLAVAGVAVGALWVWLAPSVQGVVALTRRGERVHGYVGDDADHVFTAAFVMLGLLCVLAVVAAALVWSWRSQRGPSSVVALVIGMLLAASAATGLGAVMAHWRYDAVDLASAPVTPEHRVYYVVEAPGVFFGHGGGQVAITIVVPAGLAALVIAIAALSNQRDDLGTGISGRGRTAADVPTAGP